MTDEYMTLAEALALKLPLKHKSWSYWVNPYQDEKDIEQIYLSRSVYDPVWQVQRPKPKLRVWGSWVTGQMVVSEPKPAGVAERWQDVTEDLAKALAPHLKDILKDKE